IGHTGAIVEMEQEAHQLSGSVEADKGFSSGRIGQVDLVLRKPVDPRFLQNFGFEVLHRGEDRPLGPEPFVQSANSAECRADAIGSKIGLVQPQFESDTSAEAGGRGQGTEMKAIDFAADLSTAG